MLSACCSPAVVVVSLTDCSTTLLTTAGSVPSFWALSFALQPTSAKLTAKPAHKYFISIRTFKLFIYNHYNLKKHQ